MLQGEFDKLLERRTEKIQTTLLCKGGEYANGGDRLHNFKIAAKIDLKDCSPEEALLGMWRKNLVSILDLIDDASKRICPQEEFVDEKIGDTINYLILLEALLKERRRIG